MAFMRMMGRDSVAYNQATVLGRADDHAGQSLDYYGTRGETPLVWGGMGAGRLGLEGRVTPYTYAAVFGEGGATDPVTGRRLVNTTRPGMELVVSPHKSVAVLGAIGRADDMHAIVDGETAATLEFLDGWFRERGGRRGRDQVRTATSGLTWAVTRHGTSRAGDPAVHDHVLVANVVEMLDTKGGWKALDTASLRDVLHAATVVGRLAAAWRAVELGYGIAADEGRSGRLRGWRVAGVPEEVCDLFSKRSAEIDDFVDDRASYRARAVAARTTRSAKAEQPPDLLAIRWQAELAGIGWAPDRLRQSIDAAGPGGPGPVRS
ncbi:MAG: MobF family relaxase, partial [Ilumatobacteraceae bacterium]